MAIYECLILSISDRWLPNVAVDVSMPHISLRDILESQFLSTPSSGAVLEL